VTNVNWSGTDDGGGADADIAAGGARENATAEGDSGAEAGAGRDSGGGVPLSGAEPASGGGERSSGGPATLPPNRSRAQDYRAYVLVHVAEPSELSDKTKRALALTRGYGGYVVRVDYASAGEGNAQLELRVPIGRVQDAIVDFSDLGTIVEERVSIADLQGAIDARTQMLEALAKRIAEIRNDLAQPDLLPGDRQLLEAELAELRARAGALRDERSGIRRRASFARVSLGLTTVEHAVTPPSEPGGLEGTLRDAGGILLKELTLVLYVLIVAAPFLVAAALAYVGIRVARRRADERLLERA
jgi:hypothetical protein